ncbi:hypothetical protein XPU_1022 [Xanthomonas arboricola pv. pruni str. MAFF 311562]|uniref:NADH:flavin oxidoreductase/NADH oxidase N-terminal domain-containing protein n=1 Tax=Xanthomonas arboricola pv. pruni str. MAFF 311562 TaxID=1414836 RepID=W4RYQ6_9XANT|nr:hypothetical protein XPU_1022 [Xanthomonas arboricola pv. pruni str. MAFF 311562]
MSQLFSPIRFGPLALANRIVIAPMCQSRQAGRPCPSSALAFRDGQPLPQALDQAGIDAVVQAFVDAAQRAERLGLALIELHAAHGYLMHQFLSPLSNRRSDAYGGSLENRMRLTLRILARSAPWPKPARWHAATAWTPPSSWACSPAPCSPRPRTRLRPPDHAARVPAAGFTATLGRKDVDLAIQAGADKQVPMPLGELLRAGRGRGERRHVQQISHAVGSIGSPLSGRFAS